ncbi:MAG: 30S ribosomal protein S6 [Candidatus Veblenbacteria bacterium]|nr:30S ribosomal protein S6 [Candidatus Veblenbacteria bacterium]MDZ4229919.1 30S ribosomal protein S6 [Candidatus Veblenbacteria bacterium]
MKHYELMYIVPLKVGQEEATEAQEKVRATLTAEGAKITQEENLGKRKLAYPIENIRHGVYVVTEFDIEPGKVGKVSEWFRLSADVLRAQLVTKKLKSPEQIAREQAFQEKLMKKQLKAEEARKETMREEDAVVAAAKQPGELADLDKKLEEILGQEVVK